MLAESGTVTHCLLGLSFAQLNLLHLKNAIALVKMFTTLTLASCGSLISDHRTISYIHELVYTVALLVSL